MSGAIVQLIPNSALCVDRDDLAARIRRFADRVDAGEFAGIERVCILFESAAAIDYRCYGRPTTNMELVGMLEYAKRRVIVAED